MTFEDFDTGQLQSISPAGYAIDEREIRWTLTDYEPKKNRDTVGAMWKITAETDIVSELHKRAALGDIEGIRRLLESRPDIDATRGYGTTPLVDAIYFGAGPETVAFLIERGADVNAEKGGRRPPLLVALIAHEQYNYPFTPDVVELLITNGAVVNKELDYFIDRASGQLKELLVSNYQE